MINRIICLYVYVLNLIYIYVYCNMKTPTLNADSNIFAGTTNHIAHVACVYTTLHINDSEISWVILRVSMVL